MRLSALIPKCFRHKIDPRPIDLAVFKPVEKPAMFTEDEREFFRRLALEDRRSKMFLEEEGGNFTIGGPNSAREHEEAHKRFRARHPELFV